MSLPPEHRLKGRGAVSSPQNRFDPRTRERTDDGWWREDEPESVVTVLTPEKARTIISRNTSPDIPFDRSINAYRGCEHGCIYCYERPTHAYIDLSPGLDFETKITFKPNAAELLEKELTKPGYVVQPIAMGTNTDPYQPVERLLGITREILEVLLRYKHPVMITTKGGAIERDFDVIEQLAKLKLISVGVSITTLDNNLKRIMEPRTASPAKRLEVIRGLHKLHVPVHVMAAPIIPFINDAELEAIVESGVAAGARSATFIAIRLPLEVASMFRDWLDVHFPERAQKVMHIINDMRGGKDYDGRFHTRMRGEGVFAQLLSKRFASVLRRTGLDKKTHTPLDVSLFVAPRTGPQLSLF